MKKLVSHGFMIIWILICPILSLLANTISQTDYKHAKSLIQHSSNGGLSKDSQHAKYVNFEQLSFLGDSEGDDDLFSLKHKLLLTPQYFIYFFYAALFFLFSIYFKTQVPFRYFWAVFSKYCFLSKRALLI